MNGRRAPDGAPQRSSPHGDAPRVESLSPPQRTDAVHTVEAALPLPPPPPPPARAQGLPGPPAQVQSSEEQRSNSRSRRRSRRTPKHSAPDAQGSPPRVDRSPGNGDYQVPSVHQSPVTPQRGSDAGGAKPDAGAGGFVHRLDGNGPRGLYASMGAARGSDNMRDSLARMGGTSGHAGTDMCVKETEFQLAVFMLRQRGRDSDSVRASTLRIRAFQHITGMSQAALMEVQARVQGTSCGRAKAHKAVAASISGATYS